MIKELIDDVKQLKEQQRQQEYQFQQAITSDSKQQQRIEVQPEDLLGMHIATVVDTIDPLKRGRVRFYTPYLGKEETQQLGLPWASPVSPFGGMDDSGSTWPPPAGSKIVIFFANGDRDSAYYFGTVWYRSRGSASGSPSHHDFWGYSIKEYDCLWEGKRDGYIFGENNEEVLPPWNTESYNGLDLDSLTDFYTDENQINAITYPNIYGFKTNGKHSLKMVDGDYRCNQRHKRLELQSSRGNFLIFKDDHMHGAGEWGYGQGGANCHLERRQTGVGKTEDGTEIPIFEPQEYSDVPKEYPCCSDEGAGYSCDGRNSVVGFPTGCVKISCGKSQCEPPLQSHACTDPSRVDGSVLFSGPGVASMGKNPFFKRIEEMRPIYGAPTPQGNRLNLPQSGVQVQSISGHQVIMDDSVAEPFGVPSWDLDFGFGCSDHYKGRMYMQSATGHLLEMSDIEEPAKIRGKDNFIGMRTATGNLFEMNDHTEPVQPCDPDGGKAGEQRGFTMQSTSTHLFMMNDAGLKQTGPVRTGGGIPKPADESGFEGFCLLRSGYGMQLLMKDEDIQTETKQQFTMLLHPQTGVDAGPHMLVMQANVADKGLVLLRAGGIYMQVSYDETIEVVGSEEHPADKFTACSQNYMVDCKQTYFNHNELMINFAETYIFLLAGRDCPLPSDPDAAAEASELTQQQAIANAQANPGSSAGSAENASDESDEMKGPCIYNVITSKDPWVCPLFGYVHYGIYPGLDSRSTRVFASAEKSAGS